MYCTGSLVKMLRGYRLAECLSHLLWLKVEVSRKKWELQCGPVAPVLVQSLLSNYVNDVFGFVFIYLVESRLVRCTNGNGFWVERDYLPFGEEDAIYKHIDIRPTEEDENRQVSDNSKRDVHETSTDQVMYQDCLHDLDSPFGHKV